MKSTGTTGTNAVDWEERVNFERLRDDRLARLKAELDRSELGRPAGVRLLQHPLYDSDAYRHLGHGQAHSLQPADQEFRPHLVGLRLGGQASQDVQPLA